MHFMFGKFRFGSDVTVLYFHDCGFLCSVDTGRPLRAFFLNVLLDVNKSADGVTASVSESVTVNTAKSTAKF